MSLPRQVCPGKIYLITRRCSQRKFLLRPDKTINQCFLYCLAYAAERTGVKIYGSAALANHHHTIALDIEGNFPVFLEIFHKLMAKCTNAYRRRWENMWSSEQTSVVELVLPNDVLDKLVYALSNPAKDHLVEKAIEWPGFSSLPYQLAGQKALARRPAHFFRSEKIGGKMPDTIELEFHRPQGFEDLSHIEFTRLLASQIKTIEHAAACERARTGRKVLGIERILRQSPEASPNSNVPKGIICPRVACKNKWARIEALQRNKEFLSRYHEARHAFLNGEPAIFPPGTYWLARYAKVTCASE